MHLQSYSYPALPEDTLRAATSLYGRGNIYLRLGDHLDELLLGLELSGLKSCTKDFRIPQAAIQCAMLTIFQYVEQLANKPMIEAVRQRADLKYALHLPMNGLSFEPQALCDFRRELLSENSSMQAFQSLVERLVDFGLLTPTAEQPMDAQSLLTTVCSLNRFDEILEAMYQVLEALAVSDPGWLRRIAIPYWYDRYNRRRGLPHIPSTDQKWTARVVQIGADIRYLLDEIDKSDNPGLAALREVKEIRHQWNEQFKENSNLTDRQYAHEWRFSRCASCSLALEPEQA